MKYARFVVDNNHYYLDMSDNKDRPWLPVSDALPRARIMKGKGYEVKFVSFTGLCEDEIRQVARLNKALSRPQTI